MNSHQFLIYVRNGREWWAEILLLGLWEKYQGATNRHDDTILPAVEARRATVV
tara:strand:- start:368 stop:526 length:159 start_codon:yes stop_codon:yes gene_type:complete